MVEVHITFLGQVVSSELKSEQEGRLVKELFRGSGGTLKQFSHSALKATTNYT